jgi:hypothetical protein
MAAIDKVRERLAPLLAAGEELSDARQILSPGTTKQMGSGNAVVTGGLLGSVGVSALGGRSTIESEHLDPARQIDVSPVNMGFLTFSDRRLFLVPARAKEIDRRYELPLQGMTLSITSRGKLTMAVRDVLAVAADGAWFQVEMPTGLGQAKKVDAALTALKQAIAAYD